MPAASVVLGLVLVAAPAAYGTGQPITSESGVPRYPNGQRVVDGFGKEYYPNGARLTNDYGDGVRYSNGARVRNSAGAILYPGGSPVKSATGQVRYPMASRRGRRRAPATSRPASRLNPCQRVVPIRERLPGGETAFYQLDIVAGAIDLRQVRYEFPAGCAIITLAADLTTGRRDRASIGAGCGSGVPSR